MSFLEGESRLDNSVERVVSLYEEDKALGRRQKNGAKPIKKLAIRHRQLIGLFLQGYSNNDVAIILKMTPSRTSILRNDPLIAAIIDTHLESAHQQLTALLPKAVGVVAEALDDPDKKIALNAVEKVFKSQGKYQEAAGPAQTVTAEDVARQIIQVKGEATITLEHGQRITTTSLSEGEIGNVGNTTSGND